MRHLLTEPGIAALDRLAADHALLAFDFDGTLAPIVTDPARARMSAAASHALEELCRWAPVAVISGRGAADLRSRIPESVHFALGNQGMDGWADAPVDLDRMRRICADWQRQLEERLAEPRLGRGVLLENKEVTLAVHYRLARNRQKTATLLAAAVAALQPTPQVMEGKFVYELLPPDAFDKRHALERLMRMEGFREVLYVGDDEPDEVIFRSAPENWITVRVGYARASAARFYVAGTLEVTALLHRLLRTYNPAMAA